MKTNRAARRIVRMRMIAVLLAFVTITGVGLLGGFMGARSVPAATSHSDTSPPHKMDLGSLIATNP